MAIAASVVMAQGQDMNHWPIDVAEQAARADSAYFGSRPADALALCEEAFDQGHESAQLRWRAARAAIALGMMRSEGLGRREAYDLALLHARRGLEADPSDRTIRYWVAAAAGRRAHRDDPAYSARLAREVHEHVTAILAQDQTHAGAHHALGMLHAEVLRVPALVRFIGARVLRVDLIKHASRARAEYHLRRAVELEPEMITYLADLSLYLERAGRKVEARDLAWRVSAAAVRHPMDTKTRSEIRSRWPTKQTADATADVKADVGTDVKADAQADVRADSAAEVTAGAVAPELQQQRRGDRDDLPDEHVAGVMHAEEHPRRSDQHGEADQGERQRGKRQRVREGDGHRGARVP